MTYSQKLSHKVTYPVRRILVADIGGTNSRFALFRLRAVGLGADCGGGSASGAQQQEHYDQPDHLVEYTELTLEQTVRFSTQEQSSFAGLLGRLSQARGFDGGYFLPASPEPVKLDAAVFAVPGPTASTRPQDSPGKGEKVGCPNIPWPIVWQDLQTATGTQAVYLVNDLVAQGYACLDLPSILDTAAVMAGKAVKGGTKALIGAGTGLGQCLMLSGQVPVILPSEGGHSLFAFSGEQEFDFARYLAERIGSETIIKDLVLSGEGLAHLYAFHKGDALSPQDVIKRLPQAPVVTEWYARFYGRACRDFILQTLPLGGVYITGGMATHIPGILSHTSFVGALYDMVSPMRRLLEATPLYHIRNQDTGLWGAAVFASRAFYSDAKPIIGSGDDDDDDDDFFMGSAPGA